MGTWCGGYPSLKAKVLELAKKYKARRVLIEDTGAGTSLAQELRSKFSVISIKPEGDKISRMSVASAKIEAGQVFFPKRASWLSDLEAELFAFPGGRHDDQCDSISQALQYGRRGMMYISPEALRLASLPGPCTQYNYLYPYRGIPWFFPSRVR